MTLLLASKTAIIYGAAGSLGSAVARTFAAEGATVRALFLTARAAARHMRPQGSGTILHLSSGSARGAAPGMGNTGPKDAAQDTLVRYLAAELGPHGVRVCGIHTAGVEGTVTPEKVAGVSPEAAAQVDAMMEGLRQMTMLKRRPTPQHIADPAAFLASDRAGALTSQMVNASCGLIPG